MRDELKIDDRDKQELERIAEDLCFEGEALSNIGCKEGDEDFDREHNRELRAIGDHARELARRVLAVRHGDEFR